MRRIQSVYLHIIAMLAVLCCPMSAALAATDSACVVCPDEYSYVRVSGSSSDVPAGRSQVADSLFYSDALTVCFEPNCWNVEDTSVLVRTIKDVLIPCTVDKGWRLDHIAVRGGASPDGPWPNNKQLSWRRTRAIADRVLALVPGHARNSVILRRDEAQEDYAQLLFLMRRADDPLTGQVAELIQKYTGISRFEEIKADLKKIDGGAAWKRLAADYFPQLRSAKVMFYMTGADERDARPGNPVPAADNACSSERFPIIYETNGRMPQLTDSLFFSKAMRVDFDMDSWDMADSAQLLAFVEKYVLPCTVGKGWRIDKIAVRCSASPDGSPAANALLARKRAEAFTERLKNVLPEDILADEAKTEIEAVASDYPQLVGLMRQANDPFAEEVARVVSDCKGNPARVKAALRARDNGAVWGYLKDNYFPAMRSARVLFFVTPDSALRTERIPATPETPVAPETPESPVAPVSPATPVAPVAPVAPATPETPESPVDSAAAPADSLSSSRRQKRERRIFVPNTLADSIYTARDSSLWINRQALLNVKTNLLFDFAYVPQYGMAYILNAQLEYYPKHGHFTPVLSFDGPWWSNRAAEHKYFQVRNYQAEVRGYIRRQDARYDGFYLGAYGHWMLFGVGFTNQKGYQGEGWGAGLSAGYVLPLDRKYGHWKMEFGVQVGYFRTKYDPYIYGCPVERVEDGLYYYLWTGNAEDFVPRQWLWTWFGPTRVGISISYDLLYRKHQKKGVSFRWREPLEDK